MEEIAYLCGGKIDFIWDNMVQNAFIVVASYINSGDFDDTVLAGHTELVWVLLMLSLLLTSVLPLIEREGRSWHKVSTVFSAVVCTACVYFVNPAWLLLWIPAVIVSMYRREIIPFLVQVTCVTSLLGSLIMKMMSV